MKIEMGTALHLEVNLLCIIILAFIVFQSATNVSQQMGRVLFRYFVYGIIVNLTLDTLWVLVDGKTFPGAFQLNQLINALFLTSAVLFGGLWYLYALESLGYSISGRVLVLVMVPMLVYAALNFLSMWTGWLFYITPDNHYMRGPYFLIQVIGSAGIVLLPLIHIIVRLLNGKADRYVALRLLSFYIIPVLGFLLTIPVPGMPGTWNCAAVSVTLLYMEEQDREIQRDSLTGLNNRKMLQRTFLDYRGQVSPTNQLYVFMCDLDRFKHVNDTYGHTVGDVALKDTAKLLKTALRDARGYLSRYGGDEFLFIGFFTGDEHAERFRRRIIEKFEEYNKESNLPFELMLSIGYSRYNVGQELNDLMVAADNALYREKRSKPSSER